MPPRKSDSSRRTDVSMAQFVYDGDGDDASAMSQSVAPAARPSLATDMETDQPSQSPPHPEKEKDKKDSKDSSKETVSIEDLNLPKSIITRLAKGVLPPNTQIQANAVLAMSKSATVFVNYLANAANEHTQSANKKTIMPADVFAALGDIEFDFMRPRLEAEFQKFNQVQTTKRNTYRRKVADAKRADKVKGGTGADTSMVSTATTEPDRAPRSKKQKPNAPDDSAMDVDADPSRDIHDASDAETDPEQEHEDDEDEEENDGGEDEEDEEEDENNEEEQDHLEEREAKDDNDEALDHGDSD
ncbi:histone-fold-containing protein [Whalleya microplaca]|nr:histone-fold-containing protein [Whalleya microplaca]